MKVLYVKKINDPNRVQKLAFEYFETCTKQLTDLSNDFKYSNITAKFNLLYKQFRNSKTDAESKKKNRIAKICATIKNNAKKCLTNLNIAKKIKKGNQKLMKIPMVLNNSINKHKKRISISKAKLKRKSINLIKDLLSDKKTKIQIIEHTRFHEEHLQILSLKAAELQSIQTSDISSQYSNTNFYIQSTDQIDSKPKFLDEFKFGVNNFKQPQPPFHFISPIYTNKAEKDSFWGTKNKNASASTVYTSDLMTEDSTRFETADTTFTKTLTISNPFQTISNLTYDKSSSQQLTSLMTDDISEESDDEYDEYHTDKPIPEWAKTTNVLTTAIRQAYKQVNFAQLFTSANLYDEINLEDVFKIKKKRFNYRTSSANWHTNMLQDNSEMSYLVLRKQLNSDIN